jgi:hypothetical protein
MNARSGSMTCRRAACDRRRIDFAVERTIAEFATHCDQISQGHSGVGIGVRGGDMSGPKPRPNGSVACVAVILLSGLGVGLSAGTARAVDCLTAPKTPTPQGSHWFYRTDPATQRKCWSLRATDTPPQQVAAGPTSTEPPGRALASTSAPNQHVFASFKEFMAQHGGAAMSEPELEKLYAQFLKWNGTP